MSPSPTLGSIIKKFKALQVLRVEDHQKTRYKPMSYKGSNPQASKRQTLNFKRIKPTNSQASKYQAHKLQRYKPTSFKETWFNLYKFTSFKS